MSPVRRTPQRQAILRLVKFSPQPLTAEQIVRGLTKSSPGIGLATVYRNLQVLASRGEIYQLDGQDGITKYVGHIFHQASFRCQRCGRIEAMKNPTVTGDEQQVIFVTLLSAQGLCASCVRALRKQGVRS